MALNIEDFTRPSFPGEIKRILDEGCWSLTEIERQNEKFEEVIFAEIKRDLKKREGKGEGEFTNSKKKICGFINCGKNWRLIDKKREEYKMAPFGTGRPGITSFFSERIWKMRGKLQTTIGEEFEKIEISPAFYDPSTSTVYFNESPGTMILDSSDLPPVGIPVSGLFVPEVGIYYEIEYPKGINSYEELIAKRKPKEITQYKCAENHKNQNAQSSEDGCYIATCVYGSYDCPQVWTLRRFRDNILAETILGRLFIRTYYATSPSLVKWFGNTSWFKNIWRGTLDRIVYKLQDNGIKDTPYTDK